jgi:hypothetical protein
MTISVQTPFNNYVGNGTTKIFPYTFKISKFIDIQVYINDVLQTTGYSVSNYNNDSGGNVIFTNAPADLSAIRLKRTTALERTTDYLSGGPLEATTLDNDIDRVVMMVQDLDAVVQALDMDVSWDEILGRPTTLSGYGITDAALDSHNHDLIYQPIGNYSLDNHNHDLIYQPIGSYALSTHNHNGVYALTTHNHDATYQPIGSYSLSAHNHDGVYQPVGSYASSSHNHDGVYSLSAHNHSGVYQPVGSYALTTHNHDATYQPIGSYSLSTHNHDLTYQPIGSYALDSHNHTGVYQPVGSYLTANQTITLSGDATGSGTTSIDVTLNTIPISKGGTGQTTATNAINALLPSQTGNNGKYLTSDGTNSSWTSLSIANALDDLTDVVITTPSTDQILKFDGTNWVNSASGGTPSIDVISYSFFGGL